MDTLNFKTAFDHLTSKRRLAPDVAQRAFDAIFEGQWTNGQIAGFLAALEVVGVEASTVVAAARALRARMVAVTHELEEVADTCGTGGDHAHTINVSTAAAIVVAAGGVAVAKHGNRAASSQSGSADVLAELGVRLETPVARAAQLLREHHIAFLFAQAHHPAIKHAMPARRELGVRTVFNVLGPLCNPASATHQLVGSYSDELRPLLAEALRELGSTAAWVVHGEEGLDELSPSGPTRVSVLRGGRIEERRVRPEDFGLQPIPIETLRGGGPAHNAAILRQILAGEPHPARTAIVLNAAACLALVRDLPLPQAAQWASELLGSGAALRTLDNWAAATRSPVEGIPS